MFQLPLGPSNNGQRATPNPRVTGVTNQHGLNVGAGLQVNSTGSVPVDFGGGTNASGWKLMNSLLEAGHDYVEREQERVNKLALKEEEREVGEWYRATMDKYLSLEGREAIGAPESFAKEVEEYSQGRMDAVKHNPSMYQAMMGFHQPYAQQGLNTLYAHQRKQIDAWEQGVLQGDLDSALQDVDRDPQNWKAAADAGGLAIEDANPGLDNRLKQRAWAKTVADRAFSNYVEAGDYDRALGIIEAGPTAQAGGRVPKGAEPYMGIVQEAAAQYGVPEDVILAVMQTESGFDAGAVSPTGVKGLMQVTQKTYESLGFTGDRADPANSIKAGAKLLGQLYQQYGNWPDALADYNGGPDAVKGLKTGNWGRWAGDDSKQREIRRYATTVLKNQGNIDSSGELFSPAERAARRAILDKAAAQTFDDQIKSKKEATISQLEQLDLNGELTPQALDDTPGFEELSYEEQARWRKTSLGRAGWMGQLKQTADEERESKKENWNNTKKDLEARFYAAMETGAIPRTREGVIRWLEKEQDYWGANLVPSDYFDQSDLNQMIAYTSKEAGRLNQAAEDFVTMNPAMFDDLVDKNNNKAALTLKFKKVVAERVAQLGYQLNDDRIPGLLQLLATDGNFLKGGYQLPGEYSAGNQSVRDELVQDMILSADAPDTGPVKRLANLAIEQGKTLAEMRAPDADKWDGKGKMTLFGAPWGLRESGGATAAAVRQYKDHFEEASKYYNIDPDFMAALAYIASGGERYAVGKLTPTGRGVMQIDEVVAADMGLTGGAEYDPRKNIMAAFQLFDRLLDASGGDYGASLRMYAAGMPEKYREGLVREVNRLYNRNYGLHHTVKPPKPFQLPNYGENSGAK